MFHDAQICTAYQNFFNIASVNIDETTLTAVLCCIAIKRFSPEYDNDWNTEREHGPVALYLQRVYRLYSYTFKGGSVNHVGKPPHVTSRKFPGRPRALLAHLVTRSASQEIDKK